MARWLIACLTGTYLNGPMWTANGTVALSGVKRTEPWLKVLLWMGRGTADGSGATRMGKCHRRSTSMAAVSTAMSDCPPAVSDVEVKIGDVVE